MTFSFGTSTKTQPIRGRSVVWDNAEDHVSGEKSTSSSMGTMKTWRQIVLRVSLLAGVSLLIGFGVSWGVRVISLRAADTRINEATAAQQAERVALDSSKTQSVTASPDSEPRVLAETDVNSPGLLASENFRVGQIVLGGDVGVLVQGDEFSELGISDVRGETLGSKDQNEGRALITWKTTKPALSTVKYGKNAGGSESNFSEDGYGLTHSAVLDQLDLASTYLYTISVRDRYGNEVTSDSYAIYTGSKVVSLFELITGALQDVFGWAVKK